jgi:predicted nucleotidyltransferase component of viral defense system
MQNPKERYKTARSFKVAIADRITSLARNSGEPYQDLYRRIAIDRFLARIDWSKWMAKGGYVLQRRLPQARRTKDLDLSTFDSRFIGVDQKAKENALLEELQSSARNDADDYFQFEVSRDKPLDGFGKGGLRCVVRCLIDSELWSTFQIDAIVQDETVFESEEVQGDTFLQFAGLEPLRLQVPIKEEVFAEKLHAYTFPRENENTRVKDILDLMLLVKDGLDSAKVAKALKGVFAIRGTHELPEILSPPPASWAKVYGELIRDTEIGYGLDESFETVSAFFRKATEH